MLERFREIVLSDTLLNHPEILLDLFGRHLVAVLLRIVDSPKSLSTDPNRQIVFPCVLLCVQDKFFLLTAGHVIQQIELALTSALFQVKSALLVDVFGMDKVTDYPIPFEFLRAVRHNVVDDVRGLDIGLIELDDYYVRLLKANRILPVAEVNWAHQHNIEFEQYFVLGFPLELNAGTIPIPGQAALSPVLVPVQHIDQVPDDVCRADNERFCGKLPDDMPLNFEGMSGGPIFGIRTVPRVEYWIVAIQSAWYSQRKLIVGNRVPTIGWLVSWVMDQMSKDQKAQS
jgi:hypothetical protein